jgi:hypothetical protein
MSAPAAAAFPDLQFLVYRSGYEPNVAEGPYDPAGSGVDRLIRSVPACPWRRRANSPPRPLERAI